MVGNHGFKMASKSLSFKVLKAWKLQRSPKFWIFLGLWNFIQIILNFISYRNRDLWVLLWFIDTDPESHNAQRQSHRQTDGQTDDMMDLNSRRRSYCVAVGSTKKRQIRLSKMTDVTTWCSLQIYFASWRDLKTESDKVTPANCSQSTDEQLRPDRKS